MTNTSRVSQGYGVLSRAAHAGQGHSPSRVQGRGRITTLTVTPGRRGGKPFPNRTGGSKEEARWRAAVSGLSLSQLPENVAAAKEFVTTVIRGGPAPGHAWGPATS
jgi:hypothetical protein